jgi:uncharacterized protein (DUF1499 family)
MEARVWSWKRPDNLGASDGRLASCKLTPNCVSSQADRADRVHYVTPIGFSGDARTAFAALRAAIQGMPRARIVREAPDYLYAEFRSRLMRYVDDVEFALDPAARVIHVRSASRVGRYDFGVNRARVEAIRAVLGNPAA